MYSLSASLSTSLLGILGSEHVWATPIEKIFGFSEEKDFFERKSNI